MIPQTFGFARAALCFRRRGPCRQAECRNRVLHTTRMPMIYRMRLRGWRFILFNAVLGLGHIVVLSNLGSYAALVPDAAGDLAGVSPSFAIWAATDFLIAVVLGFPIARWLAGRFGDYRLFTASFVVFALASFLCAISETLWLFLPARIVLGFVGKAIVAMDGASGSHSFWENALRDLLAGLARFRSPEFEALLTGFIGIATRLCNEFRRSRFFQDL